MQRINYLFLAAAVCLSGIVFSQEKGFYGKKTFIELGVQGQLPVFYNLVAEKGYVEKSGTLNRSYSLIDYGFKAGLGIILRENLGLVLEYNHRFYQINPLRGGELNRQYIDSGETLRTDYIYPQVAFLKLRERMIMPKMVLSTDMGRIPAGLTHEIGIGYSLIGLTGSDKFVTYTETNGITAEDISKSLVDPEFDEVSGLTYMYGIRMNYPVTKSFLFNLGFRYSYATLFNKKGFRKRELSESWLSSREMWSRINERRQFGFIHFSVGGTLCF